MKNAFLALTASFALSGCAIGVMDIVTAPSGWFSDGSSEDDVMLSDMSILEEELSATSGEASEAAN